MAHSCNIHSTNRWLGSGVRRQGSGVRGQGSGVTVRGYSQGLQSGLRLGVTGMVRARPLRYRHGQG